MIWSYILDPGLLAAAAAVCLAIASFMIGSYVEREKWRPPVSRPVRVLKVDGELFYVEQIQETK